MVDEPLHVASRRRVSGAGAMLAVACVVCVGPLSRATRVSAVVCPRFCAQVGQSAREGRSPLSGVSWAWGVTYRGVGACNLLRTVLYIVHSRPDAPRVAARLAVLAGATFHIGSRTLASLGDPFAFEPEFRASRLSRVSRGGEGRRTTDDADVEMDLESTHHVDATHRSAE